jgi:hypothetical protein
MFPHPSDGHGSVGWLFHVQLLFQLFPIWIDLQARKSWLGYFNLVSKTNFLKEIEFTKYKKIETIFQPLHQSHLARTTVGKQCHHMSHQHICHQTQQPKSYTSHQ